MRSFVEVHGRGTKTVTELAASILAHLTELVESPGGQLGLSFNDAAAMLTLVETTSLLTRQGTATLLTHHLFSIPGNDFL